jgi:hypothetical protein
MEFMGWMDYCHSGVAAIFGSTLEDLGIHSQKSQPLWENSREPVLKSTKSLILGDLLSFLQSYINKIIEKVNPNYEIEFVGYERDDPKEVLDLDKGEVESYKTLNEKREEKGLKKLDQPWADIPLNPQAVQLYQNEQMGGGLEDMEDPDGYYSGEGEENGGYGGDFGGKEGAGQDGGGETLDFGKSLNKTRPLRIVI